ncbi:hypothetical protein BASA61_010099 [Batrachochytrium salamandrivorans]|nr:hypothetical protein BASA61_010099 [Batrachochytrium salamandrivorans]
MLSTAKRNSTSAPKLAGSSLLKRRQWWWRWGGSPCTRLLLLLAIAAVWLLWSRRASTTPLIGTTTTTTTNANANANAADTAGTVKNTAASGGSSVQHSPNSNILSGSGRKQILQDYYISDSAPPKPKFTYEQRRFLQTIPERTPPNIQPGQTYFSSDMASKITAAQYLSKIKISGFQFCDMLNNAIFDAMVHLHPLNGSIAGLNPLVQSVISLLDTKAQEITKFIQVKFEGVNILEAKRYACYAVAEGNNPSANLSDSRFVFSFSANDYFHSPLPAIHVGTPKVTPSRPRYLMAFLIMVHEEAGLHQLKMLIDLLDDGNAIMLLHVDQSATHLYDLITAYLDDRKKSSTAPKGNIFLAQHRFANTWGHISLVYTQLSGFWELLDMAQWDYIVNLSNYDWPLRNNVDMHAALERHPGFSWIDYWNDTEAIAERSLRPHLARADHSGVYHPPELGITSWPVYGTYSYARRVLFATALVNSQFSTLLKRDKKRYVRSPTDHSSPPWIGWSDRHIFRPSQNEPEFLFLRPFNVLGEFFGETKLIEWIRVNHLTIDPKQPCYRDQLGYRDECLYEIVSTIADNNELILVPVNLAFMGMVDNLRCSLLRAGMRNVLHWAIDIQTHDRLVAAGLMSFFMPGIKGSPSKYITGSSAFDKMMRHKPEVIKRLLDAGFHVVYLDADTVITKDFRATMRRLVSSAPTLADVLVTIDGNVAKSGSSAADLQRMLAVPTDHVTLATLPRSYSGIMYFRNSERSKRFVDEIIRRLASDLLLTDLDALREVVAQPRSVVWTGIGDGDRHDDTVSASQKDAPHSNDMDTSQLTGSTAPRGGVLDLLYLFGLGAKSPSVSKSLSSDARTRVHFLDQLEFISGDLFFGDLGLLPEDFTGFKVIHTGGGYSDASYMMKKHELWFLDSEGRCAAAQNGIISEDGIVGKNLPATSDETRYNDAVQNEIAKAGQAGGAGGGGGGAGAGDGAMNGKDISHLLDSN